jgi:YesN/AraC family two-component response regulator
MLQLIKKMRRLFRKKDDEEPKIRLLEINEEIILNVMDRLAQFEYSKGFLKPMNLHKLAKKTQTNPKYLSQIINNHYQKNFSSYINDLRIEYILKELKTNDALNRQTVKSIAKQLGFGNTESFAKTFKKHTGVNPSHYLNTLNHK